MESIKLQKINDVYIKCTCSNFGIEKELEEHLSFLVPNASFIPAVRSRLWDGYIRLYNVYTKKVFAGLLPHIIDFAENNQLQIEIEYTQPELNSIPLPENLTIQPREYQKFTLNKCIESGRTLIVSPTGSGKSLIIYLLIHTLLQNNNKILLVVPTVSLVNQMYSDLQDYGMNTNKNCHCIFSGKEKITDKSVVISTWQSIYKCKKSFFKDFTSVIVDEVHLATSDSITKIMQNLENCPFRFGFTGTLQDSRCHKLYLEGLFGPVQSIVTTNDLIKQGYLSNIRIRAIILKYPKTDCKKREYKEEIDFICAHTRRNKVIYKLLQSINGNTLLLFNFVEKHGKIMYELLQSLNKPVFYISGETKPEERERIRKQIEKEESCIIIASSGVFSTGVNVKRIHNIVFSSPTKSKIRTLQSIGRGLRKTDNKEQVTIYDIVDDLSCGKSFNYAMKHFMERYKYYQNEQFRVKFYDVDL